VSPPIGPETIHVFEDGNYESIMTFGTSKDGTFFFELKDSENHDEVRRHEIERSEAEYLIRKLEGYLKL